MEDKQQAPLEVLDNLIRKAGGITSLAASLGMTEGGIRYWQRKGRVPTQAARLLAYEAKHRWGVDIAAEELTGGE
jgi:hypothetical protein